MWRVLVLTACIQGLVAVNYTVKVYGKANTTVDVSLAEMKDALRDVIKCRVPCGSNVSSCVSESRVTGGNSSSLRMLVGEMAEPSRSYTFQVHIDEEPAANSSDDAFAAAASEQRSTTLEVPVVGEVTKQQQPMPVQIVANYYISASRSDNYSAFTFPEISLLDLS